METEKSVADCGGGSACVIPDQIKELKGRVLYQSDKIDKIDGRVRNLEVGVHGDFVNKGLRGRTEMLELIIPRIEDSLDKSDKAISKMQALVQSFAASIVLLFAAAVIAYWFKTKG